MEVRNETPKTGLSENTAVPAMDTQEAPIQNDSVSLKPDSEREEHDNEREPHKWLTIKGVLPADDDGEKSDQSHIDVVHVAAICPEEDMYSMEDLGMCGTLASVRTERRELVFRFDMASLLRGDLTEDSIEQLAICLLQGLTDLKEQDAPNKRRAIIFVAYDLGSVVVKMALSLAAESRGAYPGIFNNTARLVFSGCPQRSSDPQEMELKLFSFLYANRDETWSRLLSSTSIRYVASSVERTTEMLIRSKLTLRSRIISLYANKTTPGKIYPAFDGFMATLGVPAEIPLQEQSGHSAATRFRSLSKHVTHLHNEWIPHTGWIPTEKALLSRSSPHRQFQTDTSAPSVSHAALEGQTHTEWAEFMGSQILYIYGSSYRLAHNVADQVFLAWQAKHLDDDVIYAKVAASFSFDSTDPLHNSFSDMLASVILQSSTGYLAGSLENAGNLFQDTFLMHCGWTTKSCLSTLESLREYISGPASLLLLHDLDECSQESRSLFLDYYKKLSERSELPFKILVTSRKPGVLREELQDWPHINVDDFAPCVDNFDMCDESNYLTRLCPEDDKSQIRETLKRLATMEKNNIREALQLLQDYSGWPKDPSRESLTRFTHLLGHITPHDTAEKVLDRILRSNSNDEELRWVLGWLLCSYRPLSRMELTAVLCHNHQRNHESGTPRPGFSSINGMKKAWCQLKPWIHVLARFDNDQVTIRPEIRDLLKDDTDADRYIWNEVKRTAHQTIAEFCFTHVASASTQNLLGSIFGQYESQVDQHKPSQQVDAPIVPNGIDITFYVVQAVPHHLSKCTKNDSINALLARIRDPGSQTFTLWAKVYWAMSNPFSRTLTAPDSPLPVLAGLGMLSFEDMTKGNENSLAQCLIAAAGSGRDEMVRKCLEGERLPVPILADALVAAIQDGNEPMALQISRKMLSLSESDDHISLWPQSAIWGAAWLDMDKLVDMLLSNGVSPDPQAGHPGPSTLAPVNFPSPLYLASQVGHASTVRVLLDHGARTDVLSLNTYGALFTAACSGHIDVIREFVDKSPAYLELKQPHCILFATATSGNWTAAKALLDFKMDPNKSRGGLGDPGDKKDRPWTALAIACRHGFPKTTRVLLEYGADANSLGPNYVDTPLWFAIIWGPSLDCVRHLLHHGGDPNHENLRPPLILEMADSDLDVHAVVNTWDILIAGDLPIQVNARDPDGETALMSAARIGCLPLVQWLLKNGADVNAMDDDNRTALYFAIHQGGNDVVQELLEMGPKLDVLDDDGCTLLQAAMHKPTIVRHLLDAGADPELANSSGDTLINLAVLEARPEVVQILIEKKANLHHLDRYGRTPIRAAVEDVQDASLVRLLAEGGANLGETDDDERSLLHLALNGPSEILKILLEFRKSIDPNQRDGKNQTPLHVLTMMASEESKLESLQLLIKAGADVNALDSGGETSLHNTMWRDDATYLPILLSQPDIDVNRAGPQTRGPLHVACGCLRVDSVPILLDHGANPNFTTPNLFHSTPLMAALTPIKHDLRSADAAGVDQIVRTLVRRGADPHRTVAGSILHSALAAACLGAGVGTVNFLVDEGASAQLADPVSGRFPLHLAAANGIENFRAILLAYRGDMMVADAGGKNCLHWAAQFGNVETVEFVLSRVPGGRAAARERYADLKDCDGWTPLCWAARTVDASWANGMRSEKRDHAGAVRCLLRHGADRTVQFRYGIGDAAETLTPLTLAKRYDASEEIINMLKYGVEGTPAPGEDQADEGVDVPVRRYQKRYSNFICDVCFDPMVGLTYKCITCPDCTVCTKCYPNIAIFHSTKTKNDGQPHIIERNTDHEEYQDPPLPPVESGEDAARCGESAGDGTAPLEGHEGDDFGSPLDYLDAEEIEVEEYIYQE